MRIIIGCPSLCHRHRITDDCDVLNGNYVGQLSYSILLYSVDEIKALNVKLR